MKIETQPNSFADNFALIKADSSSNLDNSNGDDVKGAFLALLQGLIGYSGVNLSNIQVAPDAKIAKQELKDNEVKKDSDSNQNLEKNKSNETIKDSDIKLENSNKLEVKEKQEFKATSENLLAENKDVNNKSDVVLKENNNHQQNQAQEIFVAETASEVIKNESVLDLAKQNTQESGLEIVNSNIIKTDKKLVETAVESDKLKSSDVLSKKNQTLINNDQQNLTAYVSQDIEKNLEVQSILQQTTQKTKGKQVVEASDNLVSEPDFIEDILEKHLTDKAYDFSRQQLPQAKEDYRLLDKSIKIKENILAKVMFGFDASIATSQLGSRGASSDSKAGVDTVLGLVNRSNSERSSAEKTHASSLHKRTALSQEFVDKVKEVLEKAAFNKTNDSISVKIDPPHLGQIHVKITHKNGEIFAKLTPEHKDVEQILKSKSHELMNVIQALGFSAQEVHIQIGREFTQEITFKDGQNYFNNNASNSNEGNLSKNKNFKFEHLDQSDARFIENSVDQKTSIVDNGWVA